ncbi:hypothetical protein [Pseudoduganella armeniaca]|uniref:Uncharacterized protein n=1 Tax=Pseudoduganella armeniaca TaxID=2072590 RepID=A0A2R4C6J2_9BURK|nr:hypothetical protein [Pseudoduganella armeniaca]AVR95247.1 hypothetical protein C9I28_05550 [Pseudoduganella armeniaca]
MEHDNWSVLTEATIDGIRVVATTRSEVRIDVTCVSQGGKQRQVVARKVHDLWVNDTRLSNIIDRVVILGTNEGDEAETAKTLFLLMRGREPEDTDLQWPKFLEQLSRVREGTLTLMKVEPVYGATVLVLAESIRLETIDGL